MRRRVRARTARPGIIHRLTPNPPRSEADSRGRPRQTASEQGTIPTIEMKEFIFVALRTIACAVFLMAAVLGAMFGYAIKGTDPWGWLLCVIATIVFAMAGITTFMGVFGAVKDVTAPAPKANTRSTTTSSTTAKTA